MKDTLETIRRAEREIAHKIQEAKDRGAERLVSASQDIAKEMEKTKKDLQIDREEKIAESEREAEAKAEKIFTKNTQDLKKMQTEAEEKIKKALDFIKENVNR